MAKVFILFTGDYERRDIHSIHSTREEAEAVDARVRKDWPEASRSNKPDIEDYDVDPNLCLVCGYLEGLHKAFPKTWKHDFAPSLPPPQEQRHEANSNCRSNCSIDRPAYIHCIQRTPGLSWCGRTIDQWEWVFLDGQHACDAMVQEARQVPCEDCMKAASQP